jgi:hypothetical protein
MYLLILISILVLVFSASIPTVVFVPTGSRYFLYDQNPEVIKEEDTGDVGNRAHLVVHNVRDKLRLFTELENAINGTLGYGVAISSGMNVNRAISVNISCVSFLNTEAGGDVFRDCFNSKSQVSSFVLSPNSSIWIYHVDDIASYQDIFSGVMDFETNDTVTVKTVLYTSSIDKIDIASLVDEPYITRNDTNPVDIESRVYKGIVPTSEVSTIPLEFVFSDADIGPLSLQYPLYNVSAQEYSHLSSIQDGITTNANPSADPNAVTSDMIGSLLLIPEWGFLNPFGCCDGAGLIANQANWGIVYHFKGSLKNTGQTSRVATLSVTNTGCMMPIAYRDSPDSDWSSAVKWAVNETVTYLNLTVAPGCLVPFKASYVLGGPSCGSERHVFRLV